MSEKIYAHVLTQSVINDLVGWYITYWNRVEAQSLNECTITITLSCTATCYPSAMGKGKVKVNVDLYRASS